jgi:hypothetical protein
MFLIFRRVKDGSLFYLIKRQWIEIIIIVFNNFQRLGLGGFEGPLHSCLQNCSNSHFICFNQKIEP